MSAWGMFVGFMIATIAMACWQWLMIPRPRGRVFGILGFLLILALVLELAGIVAAHFSVNITWAYILFGLVESLLLMAMIGASQPRWKPALGVTALVVLAAFGLNYGMERRLDFMLTEAVLVNALVLSVLLLTVLWHLAQNCREPLRRVPEFWMFLGLLVYFSGMIPLIGMIRYLYFDVGELSEPLFMIILLVGSIRYLLSALACRMAARRPTPIYE